ncbi:hypothetical protein Leryth_023546 [Lithospermum erythrorhizon]|nr:hypothetical protein Leryth_023546 [Lithospermum erythrorhizon]
MKHIAQRNASERSYARTGAHPGKQAHQRSFLADVALVTSLRDGMNLVSYEFVACQGAKKGVLILSEFAGAAQSLGAGAILVNP